MEQEISSGTMLGIVLIALAAVIGLGFGVFSIAKGVANEGTVGVQDNLGSVSDSAYDDYNDKIVTGTMVKSAIQNFKGKSCAIFVNTTAMDKEVVAYADHKNIQAIKMSAASAYTETVSAYATAKTTAAKIGNKLTDGSHYYINYNALFDFTNATATTGTGGTTTPAKSTLTYKDGVFTAAGIPFLIETTTGKVQFDYSTGGQSRTGNCEYLNATAKFDANLIKDDSGTTVGIVFTQRMQ